MSRIAPTGVSAVRLRVTPDLGKPKPDDRGRSRESSRQSDASRVPEVPSVTPLRSRFETDGTARKAATYPEIRAPADHQQQQQQPRRKRMDPDDPIHMADPEKYFESTNHTQRFHDTWAMFAKMEEQTRLDQERRRQMFHRSKSPTRFPVSSPTSLAVSPATAGTANTLLSPISSTDSDNQSPSANFSRFRLREPGTERGRVLSASTDNRDVKTVGATVPVQTVRSSSVDRLDDDDAPYEPSSLQQSAKFSSRSETDLKGSIGAGTPHHDVVKQKAALFGGQVARRRTRPMENHISSGRDGAHKDDGSYPPITKKPSYVISQPDTGGIPRGSSHIRQNYQDRVTAPKMQPTSGNVTSKYGRPEETVQPVNAVVSQPVESKDSDVAARPSSRRFGDYDDNSVASSLEGWKSRRRSGRNDEPEGEQMRQTFDENPSRIADIHATTVNSVTETGGAPQSESTPIDSAKSRSSEPSSVFGVELRSRTSVVKDENEQPHSERDVNVETKMPHVGISTVESASSEPASALNVEADMHAERDKYEEDKLTDVGVDRDVEVSGGSDQSGRRLSLDADVSHFPKDSVMLTGGHRSLSPRSSAADDGHHPPQLPSFHDLKPDDPLDDSVFAKDSTHAEPSHSQLNHHGVPLVGTAPASVDVDMPSADYLLHSETTQ